MCIQYKSELISDTHLKLSKIPTDTERYKVERVGDVKLKFEKVNPGHVINIINVYAPTNERAKKYPREMQKNVQRSE